METFEKWNYANLTEPPPGHSPFESSTSAANEIIEFISFEIINGLLVLKVACDMI